MTTSLVADLTYVKSAQIIESKQFFIGIIHRFYGDYATTQSLGMKEGANFAMDGVLSLSPNRNLLLNYNNQNSEFSAGIKQTLFTFKDVSNSFQVDYFMYDSSESVSGFLFNYFLEYSKKDLKFVPIFNLYYDNYIEKSSIALGFKYKYSYNLSFHYEYIQSTQTVTENDSNVFGLTYSTFGHNFTLTLQDSVETGLHAVKNGVAAADGKMYLGFKIDRVFDYGDIGKKSQYKQDYDRYIRQVEDF